jgi:putative DNA primase/helicase
MRGLGPGRCVVSTADNLRWIHPGRGERCPHCDSRDGRCSRSEDGVFEVCYRNGGAGAVEKTDSNGVRYYVHRVKADPESNGHARHDCIRLKPKPADVRADPEVLNQVYSALLNLLELADLHRAALAARGFPGGEALRLGYRTMPARNRGKLVDALVKRFGPETLLKVPGFFRNDRHGLELSCLAGLLLPCRDTSGRTIALMIRPDKEIKGCKYLWVSSRNKDGTGPRASVHVPMGSRARSKKVRITEGILKADLVTIQTGLLTLSVPGAQNWRPALAVLKTLGAETVRLAFDSDWSRKPDDVGLPLAECAEAILAADYRLEVELWDEADGKGLDDLLAAGKDPRVLAGDKALEEIRKVVPVVARTRAPTGPIEAEDDPHRLARVFLAGYQHVDGPALRYHQGEFLRWDGAYRPVLDSAVSAEVTARVKEEFDRLNVAAVGAHVGKGPTPTARQVSKALVGNVVQAMAGYTLLPGPLAAPCWLDGAGPFPAGEVLPTRNALVHLPQWVAGAGAAAIVAPTPRFFCPHVLGYDFEPQAPEPVNWLTFLGLLKPRPGGAVQLQIWPEDPASIDTLQEWMGLNLVADTRYQKILALIGPRRSGKGSIVRVLTGLIGPENVSNPTLASLATNFGMAPLIGKLAAIITDARLGGRADIPQIVERLLSISGEDAQTIDRKHRAAWTGYLTARFTLVSNDIPRMADASNALAGRMVLLRLTRSFYGQEDETLMAKLLPELPGILLWAIEGWDRLRKRGHFLQPKSGKPLVEEMEELASPVGMFVKECCTVGPGRQIPVPELFARWRSWCEEKNRDQVGDQSSFGRNLRSVIPTLETKPARKDGKYLRFFEGVNLAES